MKWKWVTCLILVMVVAVVAVRRPAQRTDPDRKLFEETKSRADKGDAVAQGDLGLCYAKGQGVTKDYVEAAKWFRKAAEQNDAWAQYNLAFYYATGQGVEKSEAEAVKWCRKAAEQNFAMAQYDLGQSYAFGDGVPKDEVEAANWFRKAAEQNHVVAQFSLGVCYDRGQGVTKDAVEAVKWYRKAAEQNNAWAQFNLGVCFANGAGVARDAVEAGKWYHKAAEQNYASAQYNLGVCYANGEGVAKDEVEAVKWYRKAAQQNYALAQFSLGFCYGNGQGVAKDYMEGYKWALLAGAQSHEKAKELIAIMERLMTREQIAEGQALSRNFKPREATAGDSNSSIGFAQTRPESSGTGFFITADGFLVTNEHVVRDAAQVRLVTRAGLITAKVVKVDEASDLALLKAEGKFAALPVAASRGMKLGGTVATVGFPNIGLQGFAPKLAKGEIASLSGAGMTRGISRSACRCSRAIRAGRWWTSGATWWAWCRPS